MLINPDEWNGTLAGYLWLLEAQRRSPVKKTHAELLALLVACPPHGTRWRHSRSNVLYVVVGAAWGAGLYAELPLVLYHHVGLDGPVVTFARPLSEWTTPIVLGDGRQVPRFVRVEEPTT